VCCKFHLVQTKLYFAFREFACVTVMYDSRNSSGNYYAGDTSTHGDVMM